MAQARPDVPIIDIAGFRKGDTAARRAVARQVDRAARDVGFMQITGHGIPDRAVFDLTEAMAAVPAPAAPSFRTIDGASDVVFTERGPDVPEVQRQPTPPPVPTLDRGLMSAATRAAVDNAFNSLAGTVLGNNARTLEDLVKEMLRPMLKSWLDDNLPSMVERIVRAEIERVSRGR